MGSFIHVGLITQIKLYKRSITEWQKDSRRKPTKIDATDTNGFVKFIETEITKELGIDLSIFDRSEGADYFFWNVSQNIFQKEFLDFLKDFYSAYERVENFTNETTKILSNTPPDKWFEVIKEKEFYYCRFDNHDGVRLGSENLSPYIKLGFEQIELSMEGKVSYEEMDEHLGLFTLGIKKLFSQYRISNNLNIFML